MNKTKIEWCDYTWNPLTGCENKCPYCYARKLSLRFNAASGFACNYHWNKLWEPSRVEGKNIFVCSMGELFGDWVPQQWTKNIVEVALRNPQNNFLFLTKNPKRYKEFGFTDNCWLGQTIDGLMKKEFYQIDPKYNSFVSAEPLLADIEPELKRAINLNWLIVGADSTRGAARPKAEWVDNLVRFARGRAIPIFLKDNLRMKKKVQEFPRELGERYV